MNTKFSSQKFLPDYNFRQFLLQNSNTILIHEWIPKNNLPLKNMEIFCVKTFKDIFAIKNRFKFV
jgi:hypothetical protein